MSGYSILMFIFGILIIIFGIYVYTGHDDLLGRGYYKKESKQYLKYLGKTIMLIGLSPIISAIISLIVGDSIIPIIVLIVLIVLGFIISIKMFKE